MNITDTYSNYFQSRQPETRDDKLLVHPRANRPDQIVAMVGFVR